MSFIIKIDNRERKIIELLDESSNLSYCKENLDVGDIQFINKDTNNMLLLIERKTLNDLSTSIKDGRYKEQKNRILNSIPSYVRKLYIFEGNNINNFELDPKTLNSVIINTMVRDNIHVYVAQTIQDTIKFIEHVSTNLPKFIDNMNGDAVKDGCEMQSGINQIKKKNSNYETCFHNMLCGIPSVSSKISTIFVEEFHNINAFFCYLKEELGNDKQNIIDFIANKKYGKNNRKIGNKVGLKMYLFLFQE